MRPFPVNEIAQALQGVNAAAVLEKDISFGAEGTVFTNVNSALKKTGLTLPVCNYIGGLGGKDISPDEIHQIFEELERLGDNGSSSSPIHFLGIPQEEQNLGGKK